tara:strand:- start:6049 stop:8802 length:2754 start_codon:yes stop_codon:yes gene_type:complete
MRKSWEPSAPGKFFTTTKPWRLTLDGEQFVLQVGASQQVGSTLALEGIRVQPGILWASVTIPLPGGAPLSLDGIPNDVAHAMAREISAATKEIGIALLLKDLPRALQPVVKWAEMAKHACKTQLRSKGWLTNEFKAEINGIKPHSLTGLLKEPEVAERIEAQPQEVRAAVKLWQQDFAVLADNINQRHIESELRESKDFLETVEKSPLTDEQSRAVMCFENRVLLVAAAGSGKTSTMVAKAGYALKRGYFEADKILLLAFNNDAATELRERIQTRLQPLGLQTDKVTAKTFHAFGLDVIGQATGKRPSLAPWVENGRDLETLLELIDELKDRDAGFRSNWDLFRIVLGQDLPKFGKEHESPDHWDSSTRTEGFWTLNNECVKSRGEQLLANWLFYNGVKYAYEAPYAHDTADAQHRQYRPDFYLTDADAYLEHWALDQNGVPPPSFVGYSEGMAWKKQLHAEKGTTLLETTTAQLWSGKAFEYLSEALPKLGIELDPNPERPASGRKPIENPRLAGTFRAFLTHTKSNRLTAFDLRARLQAGSAGQFRFRHEMFLSLFEKISAAWEAKLNREQCIDFDDMLNIAADCIENGSWKSPYELVMVDEFQDVSQARARLVKGLINGKGRYLFAVGDDWQSINRFAGADLSVMTDFESLFGTAKTLRLETTFRCPQSLCDITSNFVQKNPKQIQKAVRSAKPDVLKPVRIIQVPDERQIRAAVRQRISQIATEHSEGGKRDRIYVLGRYKHERSYLPSHNFANVDTEFITAHSSKGLETDHVILPRMTAETLGFPSQVADDPVLQLAMPIGDGYEFAEERRLFYVALTRAKSSVTLITLQHKPSAFIAELAREHHVEITNLDGSEPGDEVCPKCNDGFLVERKGKYGIFLGCTRFPSCKHTRNIDKNPIPRKKAGAAACTKD